MYTAPLRRGFPFLAYGEPNPRRAPFLRGFGIGKLNSIKTLGDPLVDGLRTLLPFRNRPGPRRSALHPAGTTIAAYMTSRPDLGGWWPSRLVAPAEEERLNTTV